MKHKDIAPQDSHSPSQEKVENNSGLDIQSLRCVTYIDIGSLYPAINVAAPGDDIRGVTQALVQDTSTSYIMVYGLMYNIDTSAWPVGTSLYCGTDGILTDVLNGPQVANVLKQHATLGILQITCLDTPAALTAAVQDTNSIDMDTVGNVIKSDLKLSNTAASSGSMKATTTVKGTPNPGLHVEYPFAGIAQDGILKASDWDIFNNKVDQNDPRLNDQNTLIVKKNPGAGEYLTIEAALAAITTNSSSNPFYISISPGIYVENQLTMKSYVFVRGSGESVTVIQASNPNQHFILGADHSGISRCKLTGATGSGFAAIFYQSSVTYARQAFTIDNVRFGQNDTLAICDSTNATTIMLIDSCIFGQDQFNTGFITQGANPCAMGLRNTSTWGGLVTPLPTDIFFAKSATSNFLLQSVAVNTNSVGGNGFHSTNGGGIRAIGSYFKGFDKAIWTENVGAAPSVILTGTTLESNNLNLVIEHPGTLGFFTGYSEYEKTQIDPAASFFISNKDLNILTVAKRGGDFTSVKAAIDSITTASSTNPYVINIGPGVYIEDTITGKSFVSIIGEIQDAVIIEVNSPSKHAIIGAQSFTVKNLTLQGATDSGKYAIYYSPTGPGAGLSVTNVVFGDNYGYISLINNSVDLAAVTAIGVTGSPLSAPTSPFYCESTTTAPAIVLIENFAASFIFPIQDLGFVTGPGSFLIPTNWSVQSFSGGVFLRAADGARIVGRQIGEELFTTGLEISNVGAAPSIQIIGAIFNSTVNDLLISHPGTTGAFQGLADSSKITIDPASTVSLNYTDALGSDTGSVILGEMKQGDRHDRLLSISKLARQTSPIGAYTGGVLMLATGLDIDVSNGSGFLIDSVDLFMKEVTWAPITLTLPADSTVYIYVDSSDVVSTSTSEPAVLNNIILGRVSTFTSTINFIDKSSIRNNQLGTKIEQYQREAIGPIYSVGSLVTENGTRGLNVTNGVYYFGNTRFAPSGASAFTWTYRYRDGSGGYLHNTQNVVDNARYDNNSGTLVSLTSGRYAKHSLYILGDGSDEKYHLVYSQVEYSALSLAQQGNIPTPPPEFIDGMTLIATIIVHQGSTNITEIRDERPIIGFKASGVSASTFHGNLLGLLNDDHPQYMLATGTRAMSGSLDMGGNQITNVGNVDGVDVSTHAGRHLPNGSDPETTAAPLINIGGNTANGVGTANSLARSDHQHGVATGTPSTINPSQSNAAGSSSNLARADHIHNVPADAAIGLDANTTNTEGTGTSFARNDHTHDLSTGVVSSQAPDATNAEGLSANLARADHTHNIPTAVPISANADGTNGQGSAITFARSDHKHNITIGTPSTIIPDQSNAAGSSSNLARADHIHNVPADAPTTTLSPATANSEGVGTSFARNDHTHAVATGLVGEIITIQPDATAAAGTIDKFARIDHRHAIVADAPTTTLSPATSNAEGSGTSFARNDHTHAVATGLIGDITTIQPDDSASAGTIDKFARADHKHAIIAAAASSISTSTTNTEGSSSSFARADHTHAVSITTTRVASTTLITTTSTTYTVMTGQAITPSAGTYRVWARANFGATSNGRIIDFAIFSNGAIVADTETITRITTGNAVFGSGDIFCLITEAFVTVNGSQTIDMRWNVSGGTAQAQGYSLALIKVT